MKNRVAFTEKITAKTLFLMVFTAIGLQLQSCNRMLKKLESTDSDFYSYQKDFDLWRVPLLDPYEVVSPTNNDDWFLILENPTISGPDFELFGDEFQFTNLDQIGIQDSIIVLENTEEYWPKLSGSYPSVLIVNAKTNTCFIYSKEHHSEALKAKLKELNIENIILFDWVTIRKDFQEKTQLPKAWK